MKRNNLIHAVAILALMLLAYGCKKGDGAPYKKLPDATQSGANTMGYTIDGQVFATSGMMKSGFTNDGLGVQYFLYADSSLQLMGQNREQQWYLTINTASARQGTYDFKKGTNNKMTLSREKAGSSNPTENVYETDFADGGQVTITKQDSTMLSGTFSGNVVNGKGAILKIREGRFDIKKY